VAKHRHRWIDFGKLVLCNCGEVYWLDHRVDLEDVVSVGLATGQKSTPKAQE